MKLGCDCGIVVVEGEIIFRNGKKCFDMYSSPNGAIIKNNSDDPEKWTAQCSSCQSKKEKEKARK
jgi:hypothetical protein